MCLETQPAKVFLFFCFLGFFFFALGPFLPLFLIIIDENEDDDDDNLWKDHCGLRPCDRVTVHESWR